MDKVIIGKLLASIVMLMVVAAAQAVPAKRGIWRTLRLADGTDVRAELRGDEHLSYYVTLSGEFYVQDVQGGHYVPADPAAIQERASAKRAVADMRRAAGAVRRRNSAVAGEKKGLVVLVEFSDMKFSCDDAQALYNDILNKDGYSSGLGFVGSVRDYFRDQSNGRLLLDFDVAGPVQLPYGYAYYGRNSGFGGGDAHPDEMVAVACSMIDEDVDFADYDWDGDGSVDQVCILYAGRGEASGGGEDTVWPHESTLGNYGRSLVLDGVKIDTYACSCELGEEGTTDGIGTFCHEFSHCLGIPDMYDTTNGGSYGMFKWDIMSYGNYNGNGFIPSAYTSYERWVAGWMEPVELSESTGVIGMKALEEGGGAYVIYNEGNRNEYYLLENRSKTGWDAAQPGEGLLVVHVDYDRTVWENNMVNAVGSRQRCTPVAADNSYVMSDEDAAGDVFPYNGNDGLTNTTTPAALVYNKNSDGSYFMNMLVTDITRNGDGTVSFSFRKMTEDENPEPDADGNWFYESFDGCAGIGGNDGKWGNASTGGLPSRFVADNSGWEGTNVYPANGCAKITGSLTSPLFYFNGEAELTFKAAPCTGYDTGLLLYTDKGELSQTSFTMTDGEWTVCKATLSGGGYAQLTFKTSGTYFIDEVKVSVRSSTGIRMADAGAYTAAGAVYNLDGRYAGHGFNALGKGIYIVNGRKIVK